MAVNLGETTIKCAGHEYTLRLTTKALENLERTIGSGYSLLNDCNTKVAALTHVKTVIARAFRNADPRPEPQEIPGMLEQIPPRRLYIACSRLLQSLLLTDEEEDAEEDDGARGGEDEDEGDGAKKRSTHDPLSSETGD